MLGPLTHAHERRRFGFRRVFSAVRLRPRVLLLGVLSAVMLVLFGLSEFVLLRQLDIPIERMPVIDLMTKLTLVAGFISFCLFALEWRANRATEDAGRDVPAADVFDLRSGLMAQPAFTGAVEESLHQGDACALFFVSFQGLPESTDDTAFARAVDKEIVLRLSECVPDGAITSFPNKSYAILVPSQGPDDIHATGDALATLCSTPIRIGVRAFTLTHSIGVVVLSDFSFERSDQVLHAARIAQQAAERTGRAGTVVDYEACLETAIPDRGALAHKLPRAIYDRQLEVYLQPRILLQSGAVCGFEALARWTVEHRLIEAREIVAVAEREGVILELDAMMLESAVQIVAEWNRRRKTDFALSVNLSPAHFLTPTGTAFIRDTLDRYGFPPHLLTVEITRTDLLARVAQPAPALQALRSIGCRLSIDDFGAGHSSLSDLRTLAADEIKIDGSLVRDLDASTEGRTILTALLGLADELKIDTVIEGVECDGQREELERLGCARAQGYLFGKPRPATEWLADVTFGQTSALANTA